MKGKTFSAIVGVLLLSLVFATLPFMGACAPEEEVPSPPEEEVSPPPEEEAPPAPASIKVGALVTLTGMHADLGGQTKAAYEIAMDDVNEDGGIYVKEFDKNIPLELIILDTESDPEGTIARAEEVNTRGAVACVGNLLIVAAPDIFEKNRMPAVVSTTTNIEICKNYEYWFGCGYMSPDVAAAISGFIGSIPEGVRPSKIAIFEEQTEWVVEMISWIKPEVVAQGYDLVAFEKYTMLTPDLSPLILSAKDAGAEVTISCMIPPDAITLLKQMKELDYNPKAVIIMQAADDLSWGPAAGSLGDYVILCPEWHYALPFPGVDEFVAKYQAKEGVVPGPLAGAAYASVMVTADAIERAGTLDRDAIRDAVAATDMTTILGPVKFTEGHLKDPFVGMAQWQGGAQELVWPEEAMTKPVVYPLPTWAERE